jgi:hypothetical protein
MAKTKTRAAAGKTIILRAPSAPAHHAPSRPVVIVQKVKAAAKRHAGRAAAGAIEERHRIGAIAGGFALGMIDKSAIDFPTIPFLGRAGTLGLLAWGAARMTKNEWASHAATGLLAIAAYELSKEGTISGDVGGEEYGGGGF